MSRAFAACEVGYRREGSPLISLFPVSGLPEVRPGDNLAQLIRSAVRKDRLKVAAGDIFVVAHKIVSKAEGRIVSMKEIVPARRAKALARKLGKDPVKVELVLRETAELVAAAWPDGKMEGVLICRHHSGHVCCNAGVDESNVSDEGTAILLPRDPDASARRLHRALLRSFRKRIGVIVSDTFGRPWRSGLVNVAIGVAGLPAIVDLRGRRDDRGRVLTASVIALADELAAAAGLVMGKTSRSPVVLIRGIGFRGKGSSRELIRPLRENIVGAG